MLKTTLLPVSLNEKHQHLADLGAYIRNLRTEKVYVCHIVEGDDKIEKVKKRLQEVANIVEEQGLSTEIVIRKGNVAEQVCRLANDYSVDFISIKWRNKNVIRRSILGSPDADILRMCDIPTLIYKTRPLLESGSNLKSLLYATDFKETDSKVLPYLLETPVEVDTLYLLNVRDRAPDPETDKYKLELVTSKLEQLSQQCLKNYKKVETLIAIGSVRYQIPWQARKNQVDLIVIGKRDKVRPMEKIIGSTAESLPYRSHCPVLIIS